MLRKVAFLAIAWLTVAAGAAAAAETLRFTVQDPRWGAVAFTFTGTRACAVNKGERMCGTADRLPKPGERFVMTWSWPQKAWKRP